MIHGLQIDRNNASAARLRGFEADLHLKGEEFNTLLSILYVGYILMQVPSYVNVFVFSLSHRPLTGLSLSQQYVPELHWQAFDLPPHLHDRLGCHLLSYWSYSQVSISDEFCLEPAISLCQNGSC